MFIMFWHHTKYTKEYKFIFSFIQYNFIFKLAMMINCKYGHVKNYTYKLLMGYEKY